MSGNITQSRRRFLKTVGATTIGATAVNYLPTARAVSEAYSFEQAAPGSGSPADPWYLFNGGGTHELRSDQASDGDQSFFTGGASLGNPSAIAIDLDLTPVVDVVFDVYALSNNPSAGNIKISVDEAGYPTSNDLKIANVHSGINTNGTGTGEGQWHRDLSERDVGSPNIADFEGNHSLIFWVDGDNAVYWDNVRIVREDGWTETPAKTSEVPSENTTVSGDQDRFFEGFEDGTLEGWTPMELPEGGNDIDGNDWDVVSDAISGEYSLRGRTNGNSDDNVIATEQRVVDMYRDFEFSFKWMTPDPSNRGPALRLLDVEPADYSDADGSDLSPGNGIGFWMDAAAISKEGSPWKGELAFSGDKTSRPSLAANEVHDVRIEKENDRATFYLNGTELISSDVITDGIYYLTLRASGTWGSQSTIYFDDITISYLDSKQGTTTVPGSGSRTPTTTDAAPRADFTEQQGNEDSSSPSTSDDSGGNIPVLNRFTDPENSLGTGVLLGLLGGGGGYAGYRQLTSSNETESPEQERLYD
jgi:hypothetical protein